MGRMGSLLLTIYSILCYYEFMAGGAVAGNKEDETEHTLETDNKITLTFGGNYVLPRAPISSDLFDSSAF